MKERPDGFLSKDKIDHDGEIFDYIKELHQYLLRFVRCVYKDRPVLRVCEAVDEALEALEKGKVSSKLKPEWWPECPYPEDIFTMPRAKLLAIIPDPDLRTGVAGMLGREFWHIASDSIWRAYREHRREMNIDTTGR